MKSHSSRKTCLEIGNTLYQVPKKKAVELAASFEDLGQAAVIMKSWNYWSLR